MNECEAMVAINNYSIKSFKSFFQEGPYCIPDYQRDYSWEEKEETKDFFDDLTTVIGAEMAEYFVGQVVVHGNSQDGKKYLIDGQQRSTTAVLLLLALKHCCSDLKALAQSNEQIVITAKALKIPNKIDNILGIVDAEDREDCLWLGEQDSDFFRETILYGDPEKLETMTLKHSLRPSQKRLIKGYRYLRERIRQYSGLGPSISIQARSDAISEVSTHLIELFSTLMEKFKVIYLETDSEQEAFVIFETLNGRGRDLATSDLLKNFLFKSVSDKQREEIKGYWLSTIDALSGDNITSFIRCFWNSSHTFCREKMLYRAITDKNGGLSSGSDCLHFAKRLSEAAPLYSALASPENTAPYYSCNEANSLINGLGKLKVKTYYPILLAMAEQEYDESSVCSVLREIEKLIVRNVVVGKRPGNEFEVPFSKIAATISSTGSLSAAEITHSISKLDQLSDLQFKEALENFRCEETSAGKEKARYLLARIENSLREETGVLSDNSQIHLEHIMPVTLGDWDIPEEQHQNFLWKLGNLTLISGSKNQSASNSLFDVKKKKYAESEIKITHAISFYADWRPDYESNDTTVFGEITYRQKALAQLALSIWGEEPQQLCPEDIAILLFDKSESQLYAGTKVIVKNILPESRYSYEVASLDGRQHCTAGRFELEKTTSA